MSIEKKKPQFFYEEFGISKEDMDRRRIRLYHGIRFEPINRLESIIQTGYILPSNKVKREFISYDGEVKYLYIYNDDENCNKGKYVSVLPEEDNIEFNVFVRENLFLAIKGSIDAIKTKHVSYDEYEEIISKNVDDDYYSYASGEYFVENGIPLTDILYIGIDSNYFSGDYSKTVEDVIKLINAYKIDIPFIDEATKKEIYRLNNNKNIQN